MKNKPKKLAAILELDRQELKYILCGVSKLPEKESEELREKVKVKLETALGSFD